MTPGLGQGLGLKENTFAGHVLGATREHQAGVHLQMTTQPDPFPREAPLFDQCAGLDGDQVACFPGVITSSNRTGSGCDAFVKFNVLVIIATPGFQQYPCAHVSIDGIKPVTGDAGMHIFKLADSI